MASAKLWLCVSLCFICLHGADGYLFFEVHQCVFNSTELQDIQYISSSTFNRVEILRWDSRVDQFVGYTEFGVKNAERLNKDPTELAVMRAQREAYCKPNAEIDYPNVLDKTAEPNVRLSPVRPPVGRHASMLKCSVYDFYPKGIIITWLRDGEPTTSTVSSTDVLADGDWYYQLHSYLVYTPRSGEKLSCMVQHPSLKKPLVVDWVEPYERLTSDQERMQEHSNLKEPLVVDWDPSLLESERNQILMGASGVVVGLLFTLSGFIYYKRQEQGSLPVLKN